MPRSSRRRTSPSATLTPALATGTSAITLTVSDGAATAARTFNVIVLSQAETWRRQNFGTPLNTGTAADTADPDGDGITNLLERAFGGNPNAASPGVQPAADPSAALLSITYSKAIAATDLTFTVQESPDLSPGSWITASGSSSILGNNGTVQTIRFTAPAGAAAKKFLRLQVSQQ
jgi:hypothetical protein